MPQSGTLGDSIRPTGENSAYEAIYPYLPYLLSGGGIGAITGALTGDENSSVLGRAVAGGAAGAAGGAALGYGAEKAIGKGTLMDYLNPKPVPPPDRGVLGGIADAAGSAWRGAGKAFGTAQDYYADKLEHAGGRAIGQLTGENRRGKALNSQLRRLHTPAGQAKMKTEAEKVPGTNAYKAVAKKREEENENYRKTDEMYNKMEAESQTKKSSACGALLKLAGIRR